MNPSVTFYVQTYFDCDWPQLPQDEDWVKERREFFNNFTLKSLLNQSFDDFRIMLLCGRHFKPLTSAWEWHERIDICYDLGRRINAKIDTDYLSITRLDSDDLYHREAIADVRDNLILSNRRECLIFRHGWSWDMRNCLLVPRFRPSPPFYTHIIPKGIYREWQNFKDVHFIGHGRAGGREPTTVELPKGRHCVIRHPGNVGQRNKGIMPALIAENKLEILKRDIPGGVYDRYSVVAILASFGINGDQIPCRE